MKKIKKAFTLILNVQITSALLWAAAILASGWLENKTYVSTILITAAGIHVLLLSQHVKKSTS